MSPNADGGAALVTGASRGIGQAIARKLAADGLTIVNLDIAAPEPGTPEAVHFTAVDLADRAATAAALAQITAAHDITRLVNNAGIVQAADLAGTTLEDLDRTVQVNLRAALQCAQAVLPAMRRARFGRIVNIASRVVLGKTLRTAYAATKAGIAGFTRTWALELGRDGITVNTIGPGPIATDMFTRGNPPDSPRTQAILDAIPVGRMGTPDDVAHAVAFFLDARSSFVTGQMLYVCGGLSAGKAD
ncbi:MAG: SDR family oxidoreductase [Alphaproteobacteria bacterium]|nr:SDR family oxidoreductase [Alphaproteobacteria bacterium]